MMIIIKTMMAIIIIIIIIVTAEIEYSCPTYVLYNKFHSSRSVFVCAFQTVKRRTLPDGDTHLLTTHLGIS